MIQISHTQRKHPSVARWVLILCLAFLLSEASTAESLVVPLGISHQPPLSILSQDQITGIYPELLSAVLRRANLKHTLVGVPKMRSRIMFEQGGAVISFPDNPAWRTRPLEQSVQLFSLPVYATRDLFVFPKGRRFEVQSLSDLGDKTVATVRGYGYRGSEWFGIRENLLSEDQLLTFIAAGRADVGIVNEDVLQHWLSRHPNAVDIGTIHDYSTLHIRVHRSRQELLGPINQAIEHLISSGERDQILAHFLPKLSNQTDP